LVLASWRSRARRPRCGLAGLARRDRPWSASLRAVGPRPWRRTAIPAPSPCPTCRACRGHTVLTLRRPANHKPPYASHAARPCRCPCRDHCGFHARQVVDHYKKLKFPPRAHMLPAAGSVRHRALVAPTESTPFRSS
jgi:hypothetical protein